MIVISNKVIQLISVVRLLSNCWSYVDNVLLLTSWYYLYCLGLTPSELGTAKDALAIDRCICLLGILVLYAYLAVWTFDVNFDWFTHLAFLVLVVCLVLMYCLIQGSLAFKRRYSHSRCSWSGNISCISLLFIKLFLLNISLSFACYLWVSYIHCSCFIVLIPALSS
jgi:hypothetical protein